MKPSPSLCLAFISLLLLAAAPATAATPSIGFSSKTVGFNSVNPRAAGTSEYALIVFNPGDGSTDPSVHVTVVSSDNSLLSVTPLAVATALGNTLLSVPAQAPAGNVTVTASATVGGVVYTRSRLFVISANVPVPPVPPPAPPPGSSTMLRATTPTLAADQSGCAAVRYFDVGPGQSYSALGQLPWSQLHGCDTVRIYPKANNAPYQEMMLISAGTNLALSAPNQFMRVLGMPDPATGVRPIIDGSHATQLETLPGQAARSLQYHDNNGNRQLFRLGLVMVGPQLGYNYNFGPAGYIAIENLDIRNVTNGGDFADGKTGQADTYGSFGSCLYVEAAAHVVIKNNLLHNCGNGLFMNSKNGALVELSQDVLVEGNQFFNNGNAPLNGVTNGYSEHHSYTEARDITFQYNHFGDVRPGAFGDCLKDRSSGLVVRYNTFASSCGIHLNLMDSTGGGPLIYLDPGYAQTYVYGNLFDETPAAGHSTTLVSYGGDSGQGAHYRQGTLFFYNNTQVLTADAGHGVYPEVFLFNLSMPGAVADVRNNVFQTTPVTPGTPGQVQVMALGQGTVKLASNWVPPNAMAYWIGHLTGAVVNGWGSSLGASQQPMFLNATLHDYRPAVGSPLINAGDGLGALPAWALPTAQPGPVRTRKQDGLFDIGAFEF